MAKNANWKYLLLGMLLGLILVLVLRIRPLTGHMSNNAGFATLNRAFSAEEMFAQSDLAAAAGSFFMNAATLDTGNLSAARGLGLSLGLQDQKQNALAAFDGLGETAANNLFLLGNAASRFNQHQLALFWYEHAVAIDPAHYAAWIRLGDIYEITGEPGNAIAAYKKAWEGAPALAFKAYTSILINQSAVDQAEEILYTTLGSNLKFHERRWGWHTLGQLLQEQGNWDAAYDAYMAGLQEYAQDPSLLVSLGWLFYDHDQDREAAIKQFELAISSDEDSGAGYFAMGQLLAAEKNFSAAEKWFKSALERSDSNPRWYLVRANSLSQAGDYILAAEAYQDAIDHHPSFAPPYFELAKTYKLLDSPQQALEILDLAQDRSVNLPVRYYLPVAEIYAWGGRIKQAEDLYQKLLELDPDNSEAQKRLSQLQDN